MLLNESPVGGRMYIMEICVLFFMTSILNNDVIAQLTMW